MKKDIIILILVCVILAGFTQQKKLTVTLTLQQWQGVINVLDESRAPHTEVKTIQGWIIPQLNRQLEPSKDTTIKN